VDLFAGKADVLGRGRQGIPVRNGYTPAIIRAGNLATFLCRVVLVGEARFLGSLNHGDVGLCPVGGTNQLVMCAFGLGEAAGALSGVVGKARHVAGLKNLSGRTGSRKRLQGPVDKGRKILRGCGMHGRRHRVR
jgi:hypothetical protein